jgi:hypothetical protein
MLPVAPAWVVGRLVLAGRVAQSVTGRPELMLGLVWLRRGRLPLAARVAQSCNRPSRKNVPCERSALKLPAPAWPTTSLA